MSKLVIAVFALLFLSMLDINAQGVYPALPISTYYNMDTSKIEVCEDLAEKIRKKEHTPEEWSKIFEGTLDPDSELIAIPYEDFPCRKIDDITFPLMSITSYKLKRVVSEIITTTFQGDYSPSPDSLISNGIYFEISVFSVDGAEVNPIHIEVSASSNYYLGSSMKELRKQYPDSNFFCCYYHGILGIVMFSDRAAGDAIKSFFSKANTSVTLHLFEKQLQRINFDQNIGKKDAHCTNYGLYRRFIINKRRFIKDY